MSSTDDQLIHQAVHGYQRGHRLLAASTTLDAPSAAVLVRTSDSAPNYRAADGPYLTGYPLADGRYVFARTWPATGAERPNTVWTHSLIVPPRIVSTETSTSLVNLLVQPRQQDLIDPLQPIKSLGTRREPTTVDPAAATSVIAYYRAGSLIAYEPDARRREQLSLAVWDQLWSPARQTMSFCTALDSGRFVNSPGGISFTAHRDRATQTVDPDSAWDTVLEDLVRAGPFRSFIHFVGSGEPDPKLIRVFATFYELLLRSDSAAVLEIIALVSAVASKPSALRRLKRRMLSFEKSKPRWNVDPLEVLEALARGGLGEMIVASDASLDQWLQASWKQDPQGTIDLLHLTIDQAGQAGAHATAKEGLAGAFSSQIEQLLTPETAAVAATAAPADTMASLWRRESLDLWRAWADLPHTVRAETLRFSSPPDEADRSVPAAALLRTPQAMGDLLRAHPDLIEAVVDAACKEDSLFDDIVDLPGLSCRYVRDGLGVATDATRIQVLARLADPDTLPNEFSNNAWNKLLRSTKDPIVAAIAYLISRRSRSRAGLESAAIAVGVLHPRLASEPATATWTRLQPRIRGRADEWDRCGRLVDDFVKALERMDDETTGVVLDRLEREDHEAAQALGAALLRQRRQRRSWWSFLD